MSRAHAHLKVIPQPPDEAPGGGHTPEAASGAEGDGPLTLEVAYRRHARYVAGVSLRLLGRDDEVDDVVQEVFLAALSGLSRMRDPGAVRAWLKTVTTRTVRRRLRLRRLRGFLGLDDLPEYEQLVAPEASPEDAAVLARVYGVLDRMPVNHRLAWMLRHVEGEQLESVAALCGCSLATAKRWISAAQQAISREVDDRG